MKKNVSVRRNKQPSAAALWWEPLFNWQREMNKSFCEMAQDFLPAEVIAAEGNAFDAYQQMTHRVFGDLFNNRQMFTPWLTGSHTEPYVDIVENAKGYKVSADVLGIDPKNMEVSVAEDAIVISGAKQESHAQEGEHYVRQECCAGAFSRTIALPEDADVDHAEASFDRNVLTIEIPKKAESFQKMRKLKISGRKAKTEETPKGKPSLAAVEKKAA